jgi:hypothetical protein
MPPRAAISRRKVAERPVRAGRVTKSKKEQTIIKRKNDFLHLMLDLTSYSLARKTGSCSHRPTA